MNWNVSEHLISDYLGSLKIVCKSFKKFYGISISHRTIEIGFFVNENILKLISLLLVNISLMFNE